MREPLVPFGARQHSEEGSHNVLLLPTAGPCALPAPYLLLDLGDHRVVQPKPAGPAEPLPRAPLASLHRLHWLAAQLQGSAAVMMPTVILTSGSSPFRYPFPPAREPAPVMLRWLIRNAAPRSAEARYYFQMIK